MRRASFALSCLLALAAHGCTLDVRDLDAFRRTAAGPQKLGAVLRDRFYAPALRAEAALRLIDLERADADGRALLLSALRELDADSRRKLVPTLERGIVERMRTPLGSPPSARAARAKDVGVDVLALLDVPERERLGGTLLRWMGDDLARRGSCGAFTLEQVAARLGGASAAAAVDGLKPSLSPAELVRLTTSIAKHAGAPERAHAAAKVVAVEQAYRKRPELGPQIEQHALPALARFLDVPDARERLVAIAADPALPIAERQLALTLIEGHVQARDIGQLTAVALGSEPLGLRELALVRLGETRDREALPTLLALAGERRERSLRQAAAELAISIGGERALSAVLRALPSHWNVSYAKSELEAYVARACALPATSYLTALLGKKLYGTAWWARVVAVRYLAQRADPFEATWRLRLHVDDTQEVIGEGWPAKWTVGREARLALAAIGARGR